MQPREVSAFLRLQGYSVRSILLSSYCWVFSSSSLRHVLLACLTSKRLESHRIRSAGSVYECSVRVQYTSSSSFLSLIQCVCSFGFVQSMSSFAVLRREHSLKMASKPVLVSWMSIILLYYTLVTVIDCVPSPMYPPSLSSLVNSDTLSSSSSSSSKSSPESPHSSLGSTSDEVTFEAAFQGKSLSSIHIDLNLTLQCLDDQVTVKARNHVSSYASIFMTEPSSVPAEIISSSRTMGTHVLQWTEELMDLPSLILLREMLTIIVMSIIIMTVIANNLIISVTTMITKKNISLTPRRLTLMMKT